MAAEPQATPSMSWAGVCHEIGSADYPVRIQGRDFVLRAHVVQMDVLTGSAHGRMTIQPPDWLLRHTGAAVITNDAPTHIKIAVYTAAGVRAAEGSTPMWARLTAMECVQLKVNTNRKLLAAVLQKLTPEMLDTISAL